MVEKQNKSLTNMRRKDHAVEDTAWIEDFLNRAPFGALATAVSGQPFIHSNTFVYDQKRHAIYLHTARTGRTQDNLAENLKVCFSASEMGRLLPSKEAMHFSVEFSGVVAFGKAVIVADQAEAGAALHRLLDKYFPHLRPGRDYRPVVPDELAVTTVYRIDIEEWSGKRKKVEESFPGAFRFGEHFK